MNNENKPSIYEQSELYRKMYGETYKASKSKDFYNPPKPKSSSVPVRRSGSRSGSSSYMDYTYYGSSSGSDCSHYSSDSSSYCD